MKIVFCSCCKLQSIPRQPTWTRVQEQRPDALVLLGDNIYLEHDHHTDPTRLTNELTQLYAAQHAEANFKEMLQDITARNARLFATYDDHDFLGNNRYGGDHDPVLREAARDALVKAFNPPRTGSDVYSATRLGDVLLLMIDARFYRTARSVSGKNRDAILGVTQWEWLEKELAAATSKFIILASSTTFHRFGDESWEDYPAAFERLRGLLSKRPGALVISGDIHNNQFYDDSGVLELISSGVSRRGLLFGGLRENFGVLDFDADGVNVQFQGRKRKDQASFRIPLNNWNLDA
jgi:phosphodiesterase/alkaline phosphatase D-like protein